MEELFFGEGEAQVNRVALEKVRKQTFGREYHPSMMGDILIDHIVDTAQRRVVVPFYAERSLLRGRAVMSASLSCRT